MKILTFTSLYPNAVQTRHGIFVENRMVHFKRKYPEVELVVVSPVPWFPFSNSIFGKYAEYSQVPEVEERHNIKVLHPRYLVIPKIGMSVAPLLMAVSLLPFLRKLIKDGYDFDVMDVHFLYPDGVAGNWLAKKLNKPIVATARGNDVSLYPNYYWPRKQISKALSEIDVGIGVCQALVDEMKHIQPKARRLKSLRNGVDLDFFCLPKNRTELRKNLSFNSFTLLCVGHLIERKGQYIVIEALLQIPDAELVIIGDGEMEHSLKEQVQKLNLSARVHFLGAKCQKELVDYYAAADCMVLASSREGWANVLLESMACGTPVIATAIWGTPEVVASKYAGLLIQQRTAQDISQAVASLIKNYPDRTMVRRYAEQFSWEPTSDKLFNVFSRLANRDAC